MTHNTQIHKQESVEQPELPRENADALVHQPNTDLNISNIFPICNVPQTQAYRLPMVRRWMAWSFACFSPHCFVACVLNWKCGVLPSFPKRPVAVKRGAAFLTRSLALKKKKYLRMLMVWSADLFPFLPTRFVGEAAFVSLNFLSFFDH